MVRIHALDSNQDRVATILVQFALICLCILIILVFGFDINMSIIVFGYCRVSLIMMFLWMICCDTCDMVIWHCIWMNVNYFNPTNDDDGGGC